MKASKFHWLKSYGRQDARADLHSALLVCMVSLPLCIALAIATSVPPEAGIFSAILAGLLVPFFGGSKFQITGPTAALVVVSAPVVISSGYGGLLFATLLAGLLLMLVGRFKLGPIFRFLPHALVTGFTAGVAVVITLFELRDFFGLKFMHTPQSSVDFIDTALRSLPSISIPETLCGVVTLVALMSWPLLVRRIPAPMAVLVAMGILTEFFNRIFPRWPIATLKTHFNADLPHFFSKTIWSSLPTNFLGFESLILPALSIAVLISMESLWTATVADGMGASKHNSDDEIFSLGLGNVVSAFFGGLPAAGALVRTTTNIRGGARTPMSCVLQALFTLGLLLGLAPFLSRVPMPSLAALLLWMSWTMSDRHHFLKILEAGSRSELAMLLVSFVSTIFLDMTIAITIAVVFAALLALRRQALTNAASAPAKSSAESSLKEPLPAGVLLYEIEGPLFFGAAQRAMTAMEHMGDDIRVVIFMLRDVPAVDVTGVMAFESALGRLKNRAGLVLLAELRPQPALLLSKLSSFSDRSKIRFCTSLDEAVREARAFATTPAA